MLVRPEGRTLPVVQGCWREPRDQAVSMLVRPEGRTLLERRVLRRGRRVRRFNARPPRRTDATGQTIAVERGQGFVSMLVRPEGRTLRQLSGAGPLTSVSMLVRPEGRTLLDPTPRRAASRLFQCSSAPKDGRYVEAPLLTFVGQCFNARPPRRTDATKCPVQRLFA